MQKYLDPHTLAILSLIAVNISVYLLFRFPPIRNAPLSHTFSQVGAILLGGGGLLYLSYFIPTLILFLVILTYIVAYLVLYKRISGYIAREAVRNSIIEGVFLFSIGWVIYVMFKSSPFTAPLVVSSLAVCLAFLLNGRLAPVRATVDADRKRNLISGIVPYAAPLSRFLSRYHPAWYPPPISEHLTTAIATYAAFWRDLARTKGETPSSAPDFELIRSPFKEGSFPDSWDYETTNRFCFPILKIIGNLALSAELTLEENKQYEVFLTKCFATKTNAELLSLEDQLPPAFLEKMTRIFENHRSRLQNGETAVQLIDTISARLTALIPEYIAQIRVVIGTVPDDVPMIYKEEERFQHSYIIGKTGSGKSTLLRNLITQDIRHGYGIIVLSPENGLFEDLLPYIPESRKNDLIYFDPTDITPPVIGFNPLTLEKGEDLEAKAGETMTIFKRALGDLGVTMEPLIRNAVYALLQCPNSTITDIHRLIDPQDPVLRRTITKTGTVDELTRKFWIDYEKSTYYQKSFMPVVNRLSIFFRPPLSTILSTPSLSFKEEMNKAARLVFLNLSRLRDLQQQSTGQLIIAQIQQALLSRDEIPEKHRIPYYLYIDEFQTYAADSEGSLIKLFNGARKFKLAVTIAHQTTADIPSKLLSAIVGNVGTVACRQLAAEDAPFFARQLQIKRPNSEAAAPEILQNLTRADAYVATPSQQIGVHVTIPKDPLVPRPALIPKNELIASSKKNYGLIPDTQSADVDSDTQNEHVAEPTNPPPQAQKQPPRQTNRRKRNRFDDDEGDPLIEVS